MKLLILVSLFFIPFIKAGAGVAVCPACAGVCAFPLNPLCPICVATLCVVVPMTTACFSPDTYITKVEDGQLKDVLIYELKTNDIVLSNDKKKFTKVVRNVKSEGLFDYIQIILESGKELTITNEHGIIILDDNLNKRIIRADNLKEGQKIITLEGIETIKIINHFKIKDKYILETLDGTIIANNIYVSTICDDMINEKMNADDLIKRWKDKHSKLYNMIINKN